MIQLGDQALMKNLKNKTENYTHKITTQRIDKATIRATKDHDKHYKGESKQGKWAWKHSGDLDCGRF